MFLQVEHVVRGLQNGFGDRPFSETARQNFGCSERRDGRRAIGLGHLKPPDEELR
jgi:hypothetical protein